MALNMEAGLSHEEVRERVAKGMQNDFEESIGKTNGEIVRGHVFTFFNLLNFGIAVCLFLVGAFSNLTFLGVIAINVSVGIYQEITARNLVGKLSLIAKEKAKVIRSGEEQEIEVTELVKDDVVIIQAGNQIPTDMEVISGVGAANESLLTGEADLVAKNKGDVLLSGSFMASGQFMARVIRVGKENYATKLALEAKSHKAATSELVRSIRKVSKLTSFVIIPIGIILFWQSYFVRHYGLSYGVVAASAGVLGMLPRGLVLIISIALATGVIKLAKKGLLVQNMHAIETLAHVDMLCLDKTGIITEGKMRVEKVVVLEGSEERFSEVMGSYLANSTDNNVTMQALRQHFKASGRYQMTTVTPFSSEAKWGAMTFERLGTVVLGAPERMFDEGLLPDMVQKAQEEGQRVLMVGLKDGPIEGDFLGMKPLGVLILDDPIRKNTEKTLAYLSQEGIQIKVISGDNPITVSNVARRAGLLGYDAYVDLFGLSDEDLCRDIQKYTVFGRSSPQQKKLIVKELKKLGHTVAMTGDGVNDVLALREADCSITIGEGDGATRQIANLVLLDSDFTALPEALFEGRRVVNNVTKVAGVFFIKTLYSTLLSLLCILLALPFPFTPLQIVLLDLGIEGYPAFFLSMEGSRKKIRGNFLKVSLSNAAPFALLIVLNLSWVHVMGLAPWEETSLMYFLLIGISCLAVIRICLPPNPLRIAIAVTTVIGMFLGAMLFHRFLVVDLLNDVTQPLFNGMMLGNLGVIISCEIFYKKISNR